MKEIKWVTISPLWFRILRGIADHDSARAAVAIFLRVESETPTVRNPRERFDFERSETLRQGVYLMGNRKFVV
jgi:hypothetical protein